MMKHKQLIGVLGAMALAVTSVPVLPAAALDPVTITESVTAAESAISAMGFDDNGWRWVHYKEGNGPNASDITTDDMGGFTFTWKDAYRERFSYGRHEAKAISGVVYPSELEFQGALDLGEYGLYGVSGNVFGECGFAEYCIVEGWGKKNDFRAALGVKRGEITVGDVVYELYTALDPTSDSVCYWSVRRDGQTDGAQEVTKTMAIGEHLAALADLGMVMESYTAPTLFVDTGKAESAGVSGSAEITSISFGGEIGCSEIEPDGTYNWFMCRSDQRSIFNTHDNGHFEVKWDRTADVGAGCGRKQDSQPEWKNLGAIWYQFAYGATLTGDAYIGLEGHLIDPGLTFYIIDGWSGKRPPVTQQGEQIGSALVNGAVYDLYLKTEEFTLENEEKIISRSLWSVRKENALSEGYNLFESRISLHRHLEGWENSLPEDVTMGTRLDRVAGFVQTGTGESTGCVTVTKNKLLLDADAGMNGNAVHLGNHRDGYFTEHNQKGTELTDSELSYTQDGLFTASWKDADAEKESLFLCGKMSDTAVMAEEIETLKAEMSAEGRIEGDGYFGYRTRFIADASEDFPTMIDCYVVDGFGTQRPVPEGSEKRGEITAENGAYDVYLLDTENLENRLAAAAYAPQTVQECWIVRKESAVDLKDEFQYKTELDLKNMLMDVKAMGVELNEWCETAVFVSAKNGSGRFEASANNILVPLNDSRQNTDYGKQAMEEATKNQLILPGENGSKGVQFKPNVKGDANCDGALDVADVVLLARVINEDTSAVLSDQGRINGDADGKNGLNADDVTFLLKVIAKKIAF